MIPKKGPFLSNLITYEDTSMETLEEVKKSESEKKLTTMEDVAKLREELNTGLQHCKNEMELIRSMHTTPPSMASHVPVDEESVVMLACGQLLCPKCNLTLEGFSATGERTLRFSHPFAQSPRLGGKQCEYTGWVFAPPRISLKVVSKPAKRG